MGILEHALAPTAEGYRRLYGNMPAVEFGTPRQQPRVWFGQVGPGTSNGILSDPRQWPTYVPRPGGRSKTCSGGIDPRRSVTSASRSLELPEGN